MNFDHFVNSHFDSCSVHFADRAPTLATRLAFVGLVELVVARTEVVVEVEVVIVDLQVDRLVGELVELVGFGGVRVGSVWMFQLASFVVGRHFGWGLKVVDFVVKSEFAVSLTKSSSVVQCVQKLVAFAEIRLIPARRTARLIEQF